MELYYRQGTIKDLDQLKKLALKSWEQFRPQLTAENWEILRDSLEDSVTYTTLLEQSYCIVCATGEEEIIGMAFLVSRGNPTEIYEKEWSYIRFVTVDPDFEGQGIGSKLTVTCIDKARQDEEQIVALHTSELMDKARHIYECLGFKRLREIDSRLGKRYWLYRLDLR